MMTADRYAEQLWLTLFGKAREITLFNFVDIAWPVTAQHRAPWNGGSFDFAKLPANGANFASIAGQTFADVDKFVGQLGRPVGLKSYKPFHSPGEAFLQNFLGMAGLPNGIPVEIECIIEVADAAPVRAARPAAKKKAAKKKH